MRDKLHRVGNLLERLDRCELHLAVLACDIAALGQTVLGVDVRIVLVRHELDAEAAVPFFTRFGEENHVAVERDVEAFERQHHHQRRRRIVLVVDGAPAVDVAAVAHRAERRKAPLLLVDADGVEVAHDEQRPLLAAAFEAGEDVRSLLFQLEDLCRQFRIQDWLEAQRHKQRISRTGFTPSEL